MLHIAKRPKVVCPRSNQSTAKLFSLTRMRRRRRRTKDGQTEGRRRSRRLALQSIYQKFWGTEFLHRPLTWLLHLADFTSAAPSTCPWSIPVLSCPGCACCMLPRKTLDNDPTKQHADHYEIKFHVDDTWRGRRCPTQTSTTSTTTATTTVRGFN